MWILLFLLSFLFAISALVGLVVGLIRPRWVRLRKRSQSLTVFVSLFFVAFLGVVLSSLQVAPPETLAESIETQPSPSQEALISVAKEDVSAVAESNGLDLVGIGGNINAFRAEYGKEKSVVSKTDSYLLGADFGPITANFNNGICLSLEEAKGGLNLTEDEALDITGLFLPPDAQVATPLYKGIYINDQLRDVDSYTLVQTYVSESLAEVQPEEGLEDWPPGSIKVSLIQDTSNPETIVLWSISTDQPEYEPSSTAETPSEPQPEPEPAVEPQPVIEPEPEPAASLPSCVNGDCNCSDFSSWQQAQDVLAAYPGDPHGLDRDNDGEACESLR